MGWDGRRVERGLRYLMNEFFVPRRLKLESVLRRIVFWIRFGIECKNV